MNDSPLVSIIVPVFNASESLEHSVNSLLNQSYRYLEIILINDASTDSSISLMKKLADKDSRVVLINLPVNVGVHGARIAGLSQANGEWIGFLDSDDYARPSMFMNMVRAACYSQADIIVCGSDRVDTQRRIIANKISFKKSKAFKENVFEDFCSFRFGTGSLWNKIYKKNVIKSITEITFPWRQEINEDMIVNVMCFLKAKSVYVLSDILHEYVYRAESVTSEMSNPFAFTQLLKAYLLSAHIVGDLDVSKLPYIADLYRTQFSWPEYKINDLELLEDFSEEFKVSLDIFPQAKSIILPMVIARPDIDISFKQAVRIAYKRVKIRLLNLLPTIKE
ncbi:glycosyltransferase family 2 protein [Marinobacterium mangrovicola]|uniref:Glycosyl transferase family 2 n=1 Tax=Marinobacterium mangrovicola TaxID=1476959 RepID=A0A4R1GK06_9GAMM|nr:glycosyltransferase family 2 protein [Marinobacterium mangrovicola]TCK07540.1 glycosyl transferase family 2 [Marinobacterium mangrovicola]